MLHFGVKPFKVKRFVGRYPLDEPDAPKRQSKLEEWMTLPGPSHGRRVTFLLVPRGVLEVSTAEDAKRVALAAGEFSEWATKHAARLQSAKPIGLLWYLQWIAGDGKVPAQERCVVVDSLESGVRVLGTQRCN